ncbi:protein of unknown function [Acidithiobacillus ferrivorans]|uniref:Uncharacterized protein n=1 Tax=Acidithiobacillus ferrivorans TaxID=160808 RepID=A0A060UPJ1_9PROT|nr:hypothetical protein [Acidithiobacillus ferrivorans]CDQ10206.1 hypothetical protein AFERRI_40158 [Acidithiobacillus ferrivorans]SMH64167.1 protein of unknown function [Acidithiobacillus ferrivorans]
MDALEELIKKGPDPAYKVKAVILERYQDILTARQLMWKWAAIASALGFDTTQGRQVSAVFRRVDMGVKAGKLKSPGKSTVVSVRTQAAIATDTAYGGFDKPKPKRVFDDDQQGEAK